jgi:hypothetical protein
LKITNNKSENKIKLTIDIKVKNLSEYFEDIKRMIYVLQPNTDVIIPRNISG